MEETLKSILEILTDIRDENRELKRRVTALERDTLLSRDEAAKFLGCTVQTISARTRRGLLKQRLIGGRKGYLLSELTKIK